VARLENINQLRPGDILGGYQLLIPVGAGGMGRVWAARRVGAPGQSLVALKTAIEEMVGDREFERILLDEARIASSIVHPNVCAIRELGAEKGIPYLVMDWVDAGTLLDVVSGCPDRRIEYPVAARIIADVAAGLHAAHELTGSDGNLLHVVHRDVSPQNILLSSKGHVKVADFGVARARGQLHKPTETGELKGKLSYMAPEQLTSKIFDRRADVFALGCCLYEASTGSRPFHGADALETMYKLLETECVLPALLVEDYPKELEEIVLKSLEKDADKRFQTAEEFRLALEGFLAHNGSLVTDRDVAQLVRSTLQPVLDARAKALADASRAILERKSETEAPVVTEQQPEEQPDATSGKTPRVWNTDPPATRSVRKNRLFFGAVAVLAVVVGAVVLVRGFGRETPLPPPPAATPPPASVAAPVQLVTVTLRAEPGNVELRIDDGPKLPNPQIITTAPNPKLHLISASLDGYETQTRQLVFDHNQEIFLGLKQNTPSPVVSGGKATPNVQRPAGMDSVDIRNIKPKRPKRSIDPSNPFAE
jgi:eukaryotic-like serine/threonine-protein kinase